MASGKRRATKRRNPRLKVRRAKPPSRAKKKPTRLIVPARGRRKNSSVSSITTTSDVTSTEWAIAVSLACSQRAGDLTPRGRITRVRVADVGLHLTEDDRGGRQTCKMVGNIVINREPGDTQQWAGPEGTWSSSDFGSNSDSIVLARTTWRAKGAKNAVGLDIDLKSGRPKSRAIFSLIVGGNGGKIELKSTFVGEAGSTAAAAAVPEADIDGDAWCISLARLRESDNAIAADRLSGLTIRLTEAELKLLDPTDGDPDACRRVCSVALTFVIAERCDNEEKTDETTPTDESKPKRRKSSNVRRMTSLSKTWQGEAQENEVGVDFDSTAANQNARLVCYLSISGDGSAVTFHAPMAPETEDEEPGPLPARAPASPLDSRSVWSDVTARDLVQMYNRRRQVDDANASWRQMDTLQRRRKRSVRFKTGGRAKPPAKPSAAKPSAAKPAMAQPSGPDMAPERHPTWSRARLSWRQLARLSRLDPQLGASLVSAYGSYGAVMWDFIDGLAGARARSGSRRAADETPPGEQPKTTPKRSPSPRKKSSPSRRRKRSPSPRRKRSPSRRKKSSPSRRRKRSPSPRRKRSPSRRKKSSQSRRRKRSPSPRRKRGPSRRKKSSPTPRRKRSSSPRRKCVIRKRKR